MVGSIPAATLADPPAPAGAGVVRRLPPRLVNQIAAGEVIAGPSSAVKELVENALDAGATRIEVAVEEDARSFSVRDDGCGMGPEDAALSIERHATSKISDIDDLERISTRGFRGEALAAIASVSRLELLTRRSADAAGTRLRTDAGGPPRVEAQGLPPGTTVRVRDLFHNVPARLKFLRTPTGEWGRIVRELTRQALSRPDVAFSIRWKGRPWLDLPSAPLRDRLAALLPRESAADLLEISAELHGTRIAGFVSGPKGARRDRRHQHFFADGRPILSRTLTFALQEAYAGLLMTGRFPVGAIFATAPPGAIDANVHPTKDEVRFLNESLVAGAIHRAALEALRGADLVPRFETRTPGASRAAGVRVSNRLAPGPAIAPDVRLEGIDGVAEAPALFRVGGEASRGADPRGEAGDRLGPEGRFAVPAPFGAAASPPPSGSSAFGPPATASPPDSAPALPLVPSLRAFAAAAADYPDRAAEEEATLIERLRALPEPPRLLGQFARTYIAADAGELGLLLADQHAVHEKLLYLELRDRERDPAAAIQPLLAAVPFEAAPSERPLLEAMLPALAASGFELTDMGGGTFLIESVPVALQRLDPAAFVREAVSEAARELGGANEVGRRIEATRRSIAATAACRAAVKAGDELTHAEMRSLLDRALSVREALRCPHGRPTLLLLGRDAIDRRFGRI